MSLAFFYVISQIVFGGIAMTPLIPFEIFGVAFFRSNAMIYFLTLWLACGWLPVPAGGTLAQWVQFASFQGAMLALGAYNIALWTRDDAPRQWLVMLVSVMGGVAIVAGGLACPVDLSPAWQRVALSLSFLGSAWVTGGALMGMLVGHWYLMKSTLPFEPLIRLSRVFAAGTIFSAGLAVAIQAGQVATAKVSGVGLAWSPVAVIDMFVWIRLLVGILAPLGLAYMINESARLRANMSATGLFYVAFAVAAASDLVARALLVARGLVL